MIKELVNFTKNLDEDFKNLAYKPSKGLHIVVNIDRNGELKIEKYQYYNGIDELDEFLQRVLFYERYSSYILMNKQQKFDPKQKIHSASPFSFAFNFSLGDKKKKIEAALKEKLGDKNDKSAIDIESKKFKILEIQKSIDTYFINSQKLCLAEISEELKSQISLLQAFCKEHLFPFLFDLIINENPALKLLKEKDYVRIYLKNVPDDTWVKSYEYYFNNEYPPDELQESDFITTYSDKKPFLTHKTATFDIGSKITGSDSKVLKEFIELLSNKEPRVFPNPLPIFIFKEELQQRAIGIFKENGFKSSFKELTEKLIEDFKDDFGNYYLLNWSFGKGVRINDLDFVSKFDAVFKCVITNHFGIRLKGEVKQDININTVFDLEKHVFIYLIGNKYHKIDYFKELDSKDYKDRTKSPNKILDNTFVAYTKYRRTIYNFIYKSQHQGINENVLYDMVFNSIKDDVKQGNSDGIKEKLNIWFSLYEKFTPNNINEKSMESKLKYYQEFVAQLAMGTADALKANDQYFAFAAGQVIEYVIQKSASDNKSYQLLEPYLQKAKCKELKIAIATDIARYKHAIKETETRFKSVCDFVLTYETEINLKELLPELLAGVFSKNQFFHKNENN